jgi:cytochrome c oxidase subunit 3
MTTLAAGLQREDPKTRVNATLGMIFFIGSWSMAFGTLYLSFLILRERVGTWPPPGIMLPSFPVATGATLALLASSVAIHTAVKRGRTGAKGFAGLWALGLALGLAFSAAQSWLWFDLVAAGIGPESGTYESLFFGLTWVHAAHVALALIALLWIQFGIRSGRYGAHRISTVQNTAMFWHFMDVVWVVLYLSFFVF